MYLTPIFTRTRQIQFLKPVQFRPIQRALSSTSLRKVNEASQNEENAIERTRNLGIIAHIDAGKTTTTERMLYYSGYTRRIGNVDEGSTVTDFLPAERARGVTIQSAAISFNWPPLSKPISDEGQPGPRNPQSKIPLVSHHINLIDTPGHADFTFEVVRTLRILDGAICILDGVAGVEAQTEKVWNQAAKYHISKIIYVNKLDRDGASFEKTVKEIAMRLHTWPALCQIPWWEGGKGRFMGLGDAIRLQAYKWPQGGDGRSFEVSQIKDLTWDPAFGEEIQKARVALVELLSEHDDGMVEKYLEYDEDHLAIPAEDILASLRRCVIRNSTKLVPVFAGASFRNIGVQPLLDAVIQLLPTPDEVPNPEVSVGNTSGTLRGLLDGKLITEHVESRSKSNQKTKLSKMPTKDMAQNLMACALAFKVVYDPRRGPLVYVRVYSGQISRNTSLFNTNLQICERTQRLFKMYGSDSVDVSEISTGQIGVIPGLKYARTGDTLVSYTGLGSKIKTPPAPLNSLQLRPIEVPPAVFFSSVEPNTVSDQKNVANALALLIREDPSLQLSVDEESGQTLLSGMGEFHLEIAGDRLIKDLRAKASMGNIEIAYREAILNPSIPLPYKLDREIAGKRSSAGCIVSLTPLSHIPTTASDEELAEYDFSTTQDGNQIEISIRTSGPSSSAPTTLTDNTPINENRIEALLPTHLPLPSIHTALTNGALAALSRGIAHHFPVLNTHVSITFDPTIHLFPDSTIAAISSAARLATKGALQATAQQAGSALLELVMNVTISVDEASLGTVSNDLSSIRGGHIISIDDDESAIGVDVERIDISKVYAPPDPFGNTYAPSSYPFDTETLAGPPLTRQRTINARVPLKEMVSYLKVLRSLTGGRGTFIMSPDRFERVVGSREKALLKRLRGY